MEGKRETTKRLLGQSLKNIMLQYPFEKITVKMITDEAGVIRPTFYNYFQDKYELLEWYFKENIMKNINEFLEDNMEKEVLKIIFLRLDKDKEFYKRAFEVTGQNSFEDIVNNCIYNMFVYIIEKYKMKRIPGLDVLTNEFIAKYYAVIFTNGIKSWITTEENITAEDMIKALSFLISNSIIDIING